MSETLYILNEAFPPKADSPQAKKNCKELIELSCVEKNSATTRFANNIIHQNMSMRDFQIYCRVIIDGKLGIASTNQLNIESLKEIIKKAKEIAVYGKKDKYLLNLPKKANYKKLNNFDEATAKASPLERSEIVKKVVDLVKKKNLNSAGQLTTASIVYSVANTNGVAASHPISFANFTLNVTDKDSSGYAEENSFRLKDLKIENAAEKAIKKCLDSENPQDIEPGIYEVVLEEPAAGVMISDLALLGFSGLDYEEGTSFLSGKLNQKVAGENITIIDSPFDTKTLGLPFDFEGHPKENLVFIEKGKALSAAYDSYTATKFKKENNGFATPLEIKNYIAGPVPLNLVLTPGNSNLEKMISSVSRGLLVTRFNYVRPVDKKKTIITGMTRDGTFLIEEGKIKYPVKNMRFNQNIIEAFNKVLEISKDISYVSGEMPSLIGAPALKLKEFNFSSKTKY